MKCVAQWQGQLSYDPFSLRPSEKHKGTGTRNQTKTRIQLLPFRSFVFRLSDIGWVPIAEYRINHIHTPWKKYFMQNYFKNSEKPKNIWGMIRETLIKKKKKKDGNEQDLT